VGFDRLSETVEGASVTERQVVRLGLQPNLDRVEWVFYILAYNTGKLAAVSGMSRQLGLSLGPNSQIHM
jgi:hypothetical protein